MSSYYCLVTGLPDISMEEGKLTYTVANFKEDIYPYLTAKDQKLIDLHYYKFDNDNLLELLREKDDADMDVRGKFSSEQLRDLIAAVKDGDSIDKAFPSYFQEFLLAYFEQENETAFKSEDRLVGYYYAYGMKCSNPFISKWFEFNLNVNNMLAAYTARKYKLDVASNVLGNTEVSEAIQASAARDFGLSGMIDYVDEVQRIGETDNLVEKERKIDMLKWNWMENETFFNYFTIEKLFVFLQKIELIARWNLLDKEKGSAVIRSIIQQLKDEVEIPEDFKK